MSVRIPQLLEKLKAPGRLTEGTVRTATSIKLATSWQLRGSNNNSHYLSNRRK